MTGGNAPLGRRDNGLYATSYAVLADVDPRVGEHLLEVFGDRGIAAYLKPASNDDPVIRSATLPRRPLDRLYVDREGLPTARRLYAEEVGSSDFTSTSDISGLSEEADGGTRASGTSPSVSTSAPSTAPSSPSSSSSVEPPSTSQLPSSSQPPAPVARESDEFEAAWASIVAGFEATAPADTRPWPASEDVPSGSTSSPAPDRAKGLPPRFTDERADQPSLLDGLDTFGANLPDVDDDEEDFQPPPPPPLPRIALVTIVGVLGLVVGLLAVVEPDWFSILLPPNAAIIFGGVGMLGGAGLLIGRLRAGSDDEGDDPDQGARV